MEIFLTVISGVIIFVGGQIILKFFIEPFYYRRELVGEIADSLIFYSRLYCNYFNQASEDERKERIMASDKLRSLSTRLVAKTNAIPFCDKLFNLKGTKEAARSLVLLANRMFLVAGDSNDAGINLLISNSEERDKIFNFLEIRFKPD